MSAYVSYSKERIAEARELLAELQDATDPTVKLLVRAVEALIDGYESHTHEYSLPSDDSYNPFPNTSETDTPS